MPGSYELRIHGVGGDPAHRVLGLPYDTDVEPAVNMWGRDAVIGSPRTPGRFAYVWGELTSGSRFFALWTLMLPFTLANLAGWMHPPIAGVPTVVDIDTPRSRNRPLGWWRVAAARWLAFTSGVILTAAAVAWIATLSMAYLGARTGCIVTSFAVVAAVGGSMCAAKRFERYPVSGRTSTVHSLSTPTYLDDVTFFDGQVTLRRRMAVHALVAAGACVVVLVIAGPDDRFVATAGSFAVGATACGFAAAGVLAIVSFQRRVRASHFRWSGSAVAAAASHFALAGVASAGLIAIPSTRAPDLGLSLALVDAFGVSIAVAAVVLLVVTLVVLGMPSPYEVATRPSSGRFLGSPATTRTARIAQLPRHLDLVATALTATATVGTLVVVAIRWSDRDTWTVTNNAWRWVALLLLGPLLAFMFRDLRRNAASVDRRRKVGQLWDVMAFWPRSFHPLAIRPYSERSVPELADLFAARTELMPDRWVVTSHSQGSVLAVAALLRTRTAAARPIAIDLITFGSPLRNLYAKAFPSYVDENLFEHIRTDVCANGSWTNFWRATDPIGREMFSEALHPTARQTDVNLPQPNTTAPRPDSNATDLDQDPPLGSVAGHGGYRRTHELKAAVHCAVATHTKVTT